MTVPPLRVRLTLWFSASILLILLPALASVLTLQWRAMRAALDHHLEEDLEFALQMLVIRDGRVEWRVEADRDPGYDPGPQRWVEAYDLVGRVAFLRGPAARPDVASALPVPDAAVPGFLTGETPAGATVRLLTSRRTVDDRALVVRVARSEDGLRADLRRLILIFAVLAPLAVIAASVTGYLVSGRMLAPLARMAERARVISADRLSERLPVDNPSDELGQLAVVFNDAFARIEASFDRLRQFTADVSHELRTPLTAIRSVGEVSLRRDRTAEAHREAIGSMLEEADHLTQVVETLLTLSRWDSGHVKPDAQAIDLSEVVREAGAHLAVLADERGVSLEIALPSPLRVRGDRTMVRQALVNVLDNAIKFTAVGTRVTIQPIETARRRGITVDDVGPGIPEAERRRVVERFYRLDRDRERGTQGTGLGLAIAQRAVSAQQGELSLGEAPGGGARIAIVLPRA